MDSQPVIRVGNMDTTSNSEVSGVAPNITTNKKDENKSSVSCLKLIDAIPSDDKSTNVDVLVDSKMEVYVTAYQYIL